MKSTARLVLIKEIREALRDRSMLFNLILFPLFFYPILGFGAYQVFLVVEGASERKQLTIMLDADVPQEVVEQLGQADDGLAFVDVPAQMDSPDGPPAAATVRSAFENDGPDGDTISAVIAWWRVNPETSTSIDSVRVFYDSSREASVRARRSIWPVLEAHRDSVLDARGVAAGLSQGDVVLWELNRKDTSTSRQWGRYILSMMIPIFVVIMIPQGCYYATLDTVVGERERGTLETLLSAPATRMDIIRGKFMFVVLSSVWAFLLNLLSLAIFGRFAISMIGLGDSFSLTVHPMGLLLILVAVVAAASFLAAAMMLVAIPAKNYREGQAALMPLYMVPAFAGFAVSMQSEFTMTQAFIPMVNLVALMKTVIQGDVPLGPAAVTLAVLAGLAVLSMRLAARFAEREEVYFSPQLTLRGMLRGRFSK